MWWSVVMWTAQSKIFDNFDNTLLQPTQATDEKMFHSLLLSLKYS